MVCLDLSTFDLATLNADGIAQLVAAGVDKVILGSWPQDPMLTLGKRLQAAGITIIGTYGLVYFGDSYGETRDINAAITNANILGVRRVWMDCETDANQNGWHSAPTPTPAQRVAAMQTARGLIQAAFLEPGMYGPGWWWPDHTGNSTAFCDMPLWASNYTGGPEIRTVSYGGWTDVAVHQYTSSLSLAGKDRDANYVFEEADMTPDEITKVAQQAAEAFIGANFRTYLDLALNGGPGQFADANGKPLPLVRDEDVVERVAALEASKPGGLPDHKHISGGVA